MPHHQNLCNTHTPYLETMKINYDEAMNHLQTMFSGIDREVIHNILAMHSNLGP